MEHKDYILIARALATSRRRTNSLERRAFDQQGAIDVLCEDFADALAAGNQNFNPVDFLAIARGEKPLESMA